MKWHRVRTVLLHTLYHATHSRETWIDLVWYTFFNFLVMGFMSYLFAKNNVQIAQMIMMGLILWEIVRIGQYCITVGLMWEVWSSSLRTMFVSPLTMKEFMLGQMISGIIKTSLVFVLLSVVTAQMFHFSILSLGGWLILYFVLLLSFAFAMGFFTTGLILRYGMDVQSLAWGLIYIFQPISAVFYPVEFLPKQIQWMAYLSPVTYIMEAARSQVTVGTVPLHLVGWSIVTTFLYVLGGVGFLSYMFRWSRKTGEFARLGH